MTTSTKLTTSTKRVAGATTALILLTALNFVNYIDRYILPGVQEMVKGEFHASDAEIGSLTTWFMLAYICAAPITGWLGDRFPRKPLVVFGAIFWSSMNLLSATVHTFGALNLRHAALGLGEASFGIFAPAILSDFFPAQERNRVLTIFNLAIPVGAALGYLIGGMVGSHWGWRAPFYVSAVPGILFALMILFLMREPERGASEVEKTKIGKADLLALVTNRAYLSSIFGYAFITFCMGGLSWWMPSFLHRVNGYSLGQAGFTIGAITAVTGIVGTATGGWIASRLMKRNSSALYLVSAFGCLSSIPFALMTFFGPSWATLPSLAGAEICLFLGTGPINAATVNAVTAANRASALAGQLLLIHLLGDMPSPLVIGLVSDHSNLRLGMGITTLALVIAGVILLAGGRFVKRHPVAA